MNRMKFRYSFQQIVDLKNNERTQAEWFLSEAIGKLRAEESSLHELQCEKNRLQEEIASSSAGVTTVSQLLVVQEYVDHLSQQIMKKHRDVQAAQQHVAQKQQALTDRMLDEKVWNKAREKAYRKFTAVVRKKEQEALDEMASVRFQRIP
jgi:flagellar FliJ protein